MPIEMTRSLLRAALEGALDQVRMTQDPVFVVQIPSSCPGVPHEGLSNRSTWVDPAK